LFLIALPPPRMAHRVADLVQTLHHVTRRVQPRHAGLQMLADFQASVLFGLRAKLHCQL
jgi:hypothetical protein